MVKHYKELAQPYWQGFKRSLATYTRLPVKVDWQLEVKHTSPVAFLPWVGVIVALLSAWPLWFDWSTSLQALLMLLTAVLLTGGFHEDGLMDACDGLVGGWQPEQRLKIMKDSRIGSYAALSVWFSLSLKWLLLSELLSVINHSFLGLILALLAWCAVHIIARFTPLVIMNSLDYVSTGQSKAKSMIAQLSLLEWGVALLPVVLIGLSAFDGGELVNIALIVTAYIAALRFYLQKKIAGYNGDTLGACEQLAEVLVLFCLLVSYT